MLDDAPLDMTRHGGMESSVKQIGKVKIFTNKLLGQGATAIVYEGEYTCDSTRVNVSGGGTKPKKLRVAVKCISKQKVDEYGPKF